MKTPASLLERLRQPEQPREAWERFVHLYTPILLGWTRKVGLQESDAWDLVQDIFKVLVGRLPTFTYDPERSFSAWLKSIAMNRWRNFCRERSRPTAQGGEAGLANAVSPERGEALWEEKEHRLLLVGRALEVIRPEFSEATWKKFTEHCLAGRPAREVAAELNTTEGAVYVTGSRVLKRLREELEGMLE